LCFPRSSCAGKPFRVWLPWIYIFPFLIFLAFVAWQFSVSSSLLTWWNSWLTGEYVVAVIYMLLGMVLFVFQRLTAKSEADRMKSGWVIFGGSTSLVLGMGLYILPSLLFEQPLISPNWLGLANFPFIISISIAIWRYSLFDINVIIRRSVVYVLLTSLLALLYFSMIALLQMGITSLGGEQSSFVIVISTLAIAGLFNPLRKSIQNYLDRRYYRRRYNAEQSLADFAAAASKETDLDRLAEQFIEVVSDTLQPERVDLWLRQNKNN
jgi:hypothetical protein